MNTDPTRLGRTIERSQQHRTLIWRWVGYLAMASLTFQFAHFVEHIAQLSHWFISPAAPPWLTPWAEVGRALLVVDGSHGSGNELLHLVGNLIFMGGLVALALVLRAEGRTIGEIRHLNRALAVQGIHVLEHVALTVSYLAFGSPLGLSTLIGTAQGEFGIGLRVWAHFLINLAATYYALRAVSEWRVTRRLRVARRQTAQP